MSSQTATPEVEIATTKQSQLSSRAAIWISVWTVFLLLAYYFPCLSGAKDFYVSDSSYFFEPLFRFAGEQLKQGHLPLWNPLLYCGMSQAAVPSPSIFYAPSYFVFLLPFSQGLSLYMIFHQLLFGIGAYLLARELKFSRSAALFAAISAVLMSYCFSLTRNPTLPATASWIPLALYLQRKISSIRSRAQIFWRLATALSVSMIIAAGRPEVFLPGIVILLFDSSFVPALDFLRYRQFNEKTKTALLRVATLFFGLSIAGPVLLPALEWTQLSPRAHGLKETDVFSWSANWYDFMSMIYSYPVGDVAGDMTIKGTIIGNLVLSKRFVLPFLTSGYVGSITLTFAFLAFCNKSWKQRFFFLGLLLLSNTLAAGNLLPLAPFLLKVAPFLSIIRYPVKILVFSVIILASAAAVGLDLALRKQISMRAIMFASVIWLIPALFSCLVLICPGFCFCGAQQLNDAFYGPIIRDANVIMAKSILCGSLLGLALLLSIYFLQQEKIKVQFFSIAVLIIFSSNLFLSASSYPFLTKGGAYCAKSALFDYLKKFLQANANNGVQGRILPFYHEGLRIPVWYKKNSPEAFQEKFFGYAHSIGVFNTTIDYQVPQSYGYEAAATEKFSSFFTDAKEYSTQYLDGSNHSTKAITDRPIARFCRLTATQYVLTQESFVRYDIPLPTMDERFFELFGHSDKNNSRVYRVINTLPRIYFANKIRLVDSWQALEKTLCNPEEIPDDKEEIVYLLKSQDSQALVNSGLSRLLEGKPGAEKDRLRQFSLDRDDGQSLELSVESGENEILVIGDQEYPGWIAELDHKQVPIMKANLYARAIALPPGKHKLRLRFVPTSAIAGFSLAAVSILLLLLLSLFI